MNGAEPRAAPEPGGGELARLDELRAVTHEYAVVCREAISLRAWLVLLALVACAVWIGRSDAAWGMLAAAACFPVTVAVLALDRRMGWAAPLGAVERRPADRLEHAIVVGRWPWVAKVLVAVGTALAVCNAGLSRGVVPLEQPARWNVAAVLIAASCLLAGWYALVRDRRKAPPMFAGSAVLFASGSHLFSGWFALLLAALWIAGGLLATVVQRRQLSGLERRLAFLREHAR